MIKLREVVVCNVTNDKCRSLHSVSHGFVLIFDSVPLTYNESRFLLFFIGRRMSSWSLLSVSNCLQIFLSVSYRFLSKCFFCHIRDGLFCVLCRILLRPKRSTFARSLSCGKLTIFLINAIRCLKKTWSHNKFRIYPSSNSREFS